MIVNVINARSMMLFHIQIFLHRAVCSLDIVVKVSCLLCVMASWVGEY